MDGSRRRRVVESVYDKPLPLKGKPEVREGGRIVARVVER